MVPIRIQNIDKNSGWFQFIAYICDKCNFNCAYCYNEKHRSNKELDLNVVLEYLKFLQQHLQKPIEITLLGGETTLHSQLLNFCKQVSKLNNIVLTIYSNGSQPTSYYEYLLNLNNIRIDLSYHTINGKRNNDCIKKIIYLANKGYEHSKFNITLMLENNNTFEDIKKINQIFMKMNIHQKHNIDYRLIRNFNNIDDMSYYSSNELMYFKDNYINFNKVKNFEVLFDDNSIKQYSIEEFDINTFCKFNGWNCNAGKELLYCHCNGNVYSCQIQYIEGNNHIFNIYNKFELPSEKPIICNCKNCRIDCEITKWK